MSGELLIENARIIDPASGRDFNGAILIADGRITGVVERAAPGAPHGVTRLDANGLIVAPGLIDMRVFTGEPGHDYRETLASAAEAAAAGGVTSFVTMPDTDPPMDDPALIDFVMRRSSETAKVNVLPAAALTRGLGGADIAEYGLLREAGAVCLTDGRKSVRSAGVMRGALAYAANFGMPVVHLPMDADLVGDGVMASGAFATALGLKGIPPEAETIGLARDLQLAAATGARYHAAQISTSGSIELLAAARKHCKTVSAGVSINNLSLNENDIGAYRSFFKLMPPLRSEDDRQALVAALADGTIDVIHSDHDPQDSEGKRQPFADAAFGAIGLETLLGAALRLYHDGSVPLIRLLGAMTIRPAEVLGLDAGRIAKGAPADLMIFDPDEPWIVDEAALRSRSRNSPFEGARMTGRVRHTIVGGRPVFGPLEETGT